MRPAIFNLITKFVFLPTVRILKEDGTESEINELGRIVCKLPMPPGTLSTLYKAPERFISAYFQAYPGYYDTCDAGIKDEFGYVHILAREDDVINVAGHRLSTSSLEEVVLKVTLNLIQIER